MQAFARVGCSVWLPRRTVTLATCLAVLLIPGVEASGRRRPWAARAMLPRPHHHVQSHPPPSFSHPPRRRHHPGSGRVAWRRGARMRGLPCPWVCELAVAHAAVAARTTLAAISRNNNYNKLCAFEADCLKPACRLSRGTSRSCPTAMPGARLDMLQCRCPAQRLLRAGRGERGS